MFTLIISFFFQMALAEMNPLVKAVALGCGDRVYTDKIPNSPDLQELSDCYQVGLNEILRKRISNVQLAFNTCQEFKREKMLQLRCLERFTNSLEDPKLIGLFKQCDTKTADPKKKRKSYAQMNLQEKEALLNENNKKLDCLNNLAKASEEKQKEGISLSGSELMSIGTAKVACGNKSVRAEIATAEDVDGMVNCYQTAMLGLGTTPPASFYNLSVELCQNYNTPIQQNNCYEHVVQLSNKPEFKQNIKTCYPDDIKISKKEKTLAGKFKTNAEYEKFHKELNHCYVDEFQNAAYKLANPTKAPDASAQGSQ